MLGHGAGKANLSFRSPFAKTPAMALESFHLTTFLTPKTLNNLSLLSPLKASDEFHGVVIKNSRLSCQLLCWFCGSFQKYFDRTHFFFQNKNGLILRQRENMTLLGYVEKLM